jgi:S-adenosylmethionine-dependent methyltransferase
LSWANSASWGRTFDVVMCHNVVGFMADAPEAITLLARQVSPGGHLSLVVNNAVAEPFRFAVLEGNFSEARRWVERRPRSRPSNMFDHPLALYTSGELELWMQVAGLSTTTVRGNTTVTSYLDERRKPPDYSDLLSLEVEFGRWPPYNNVSLFLHCHWSPTWWSRLKLAEGTCYMAQGRQDRIAP